jgi:hypothetical protein
MKHLPIYLSVEENIEGLIQYRWMHPFERLDITYTSKPHIEVYVVEEISTFILYYFEPHLKTRINHILRHDNSEEVSLSENLLIFSHPRRPL